MVIYTAICRTMSKSAKTAFIVWFSTKRERFDVYMCTESKAKQTHTYRGAGCRKELRSIEERTTARMDYIIN